MNDLKLEEGMKKLQEEINNAGKNSTKITNQSALQQRQTNSNENNYTPIEEANKGHDEQTSSKFTELFSLIRHFDINREIPKREFIGGLFPRGFLSVIGGAPGVGKSWLISDFIVKLSRGENYKGEKCTPRKSLLLVGELGVDGIDERIKQLHSKLNPQFTSMFDQREAEEKGFSLLLNKDSGQENIEAIVKEFKPDILFSDSLISFFDGDENKNAEISAAIKFLSRLAKKYNIATGVTHHARKRLASEQTKPLCLDDMIGASAINRLAALVIAIERNRSLQANKVTCLKSWFEYFKPFLYKIENDDYGVKLKFNFDFQELTESLDGNSNKSNVSDWREKILIVLRSKQHDGATNNEIANATGQEINTIKQHLKRLSDKNEIVRIGRGKYILPEYVTNENDEANEAGNRNEQLTINDKSDDN